ncbi:MAG TPA: MFS transporter [Longimicrobium sp.]|jgi:MFS family permease|uniref:MFS transporter n=1 Tax=Longimicrobium sp. TaxID=2029185 RepID=UPI002EDACF02
MTERLDPYVSLRNPAFRWYVAALVAMTLGTQIQATVVGWQVYAITRDPLALGLVGLAEALPFIGAALFAGHVADRHNRKALSMYSTALQVLCAVALLVLAMRPEFLRDGRVWPIFAVVFASGVARSFLQPARTALGAEIVPRETYANAIAWRSSMWQGAAVLGPALGGLLYGFADARLAYVAEAVLCALALLALGAMAYTPRTREIVAGEEGIWKNLTVGIRFLFTQPALLGAQVLDLFSVLFGGAVALLPIFADERLHVGPQGLGVLRAAPAAGAVLMSVIIAHRRLRNAGPKLFLCVAGFGLCWIVFALSRSFWLSLALLAISGMLDNVSVVIRSTLLTVRTPEHMLGRVSAVNQIFIGSSNEIGSFESGVAARLLGVVRSVVLGGVATLAVVGITAWRVPALRKLDELN